MLMMLSGMSTLASAFKLVLLLVVFIALLVGAHLFTKWYAKSGFASPKSSNIKVIESQQLAPGKSIVIAKIGGKYVSFVLFKESAEFLTELNEEDLVFPAEVSEVQNASFMDVFRNVKHSKSNSDDLRNKE